MSATEKIDAPCVRSMLKRNGTGTKRNGRRKHLISHYEQQQNSTAKQKTFIMQLCKH